MRIVSIAITMSLIALPTVADSKVTVSSTHIDNDVVSCTTYVGSTDLADRMMNEAARSGLFFSHKSCEAMHVRDNRDVIASCVWYDAKDIGQPALVRQFSYQEGDTSRLNRLCSKMRGKYSYLGSRAASSARATAESNLHDALRTRRLSEHGQW